MAITFDTRAARGSGPSAGEGDDVAGRRDRAFALARRHSRLVRALRVALPLASVLLLAAYGLVLFVSWQLGSSRIKVGSIQLTADDLKMKDPVYVGVTKEGGRYQVQAKRADVSLNQNAPIKLFDITGELTESKGVTKLKAKHGLFNNTKGELELFDGIDIESTTGLVARLSRAMIYQKENRIVSKHPVTASTPTGSVQASTMTMENKKKLVAFRGAVAVRLISSSQGQVAIGKDPRQPVDIYSEELDVDDAQKTAHFRDKVVATQGETTLNTPYLFVKYEGKAAEGLTGGAAAPADEPASRVTFLWARNGVDITAGNDRRITSELADFDVKADTALFVGKVRVTQDKNVLDGERLFVDRKAGKSHLESPAEAGRPAGRIAAILYQSAKANAPPAAAPAPNAEDAKANIFGSFKSDPNAPIEIEADMLDVLDASKKAIFSGNVLAQQGGMVIRTVELTAIYTGQAGLAVPSGTEAGAKSSAQIVRIEARRKVLITSKDGQNATAEWANFDVKSNTALLGGGVVVMRGKDMAEGPRLKIDLTTGLYRFEVDADAKQPTVVPPVASTSAKSPDPSEAPENRTCPPGKQCMLFYPKDAKDKAQDLLKKAPSLNAQ